MAAGNKIFGVPLSTGVQLQLEHRVKAQTDGKITGLEGIQETNNGGSWVRCISGVDTLTDAQIKKIKELQQYPNDPNWEAARQAYYKRPGKSSSSYAEANVLYGGTAYRKNKSRTGINLKKIQSDYNNGSYVTSETGGIVPMAGLTGFRVKSKSQFGTLREIELSIQANSPEQLEALERLYFRPGYSMLVEWGNSFYRDIDGTLASSTNSALDPFLKERNIENTQTKIDKLIVDSGYNYDGMMGKVVNFSWNYSGNGVYDCTLKIVGKGEVLESISSTYYDPSDDKINKYISNLKNKDGNRDENDLLLNVLKAFTNPNDETLKEYKKEYFPEGKLWVYRGNTLFTDAKAEGYPDTTRLSYMSLRDILYVLNKTILEKEFSGNNGTLFSTVFGETEFTTWAYNISSNPFICGLPADPDVYIAELSGIPYWAKAYRKPYVIIGGGGDTYPSAGRKDKFPEYLKTAKRKIGELHGDTANEADDPLRILVNMEYLVQMHRENVESKSKNSDVSISVFKFVKTLLSKVSTTLGGQTRLDLHVFPETNKWTIIDRTKYNPIDRASELPLINVVGLGSQVTQVGIASKISSNMVNMLSIAAASSGLTDQDQDGIMQYNANLVDRHYKPKNPIIDEMKKQKLSTWTVSQEATADMREVYRQFANGYATPDLFDKVGQAYQRLAENSINRITNQRRAANKEVAPHDPILPIELSLTLRGIAGIKMGEAFSINKEILPTRYFKRVGFVVTGLEHIISNDNTWFTDIKTSMFMLPVKELIPTVPDPEPELEPEELETVAPTKTTEDSKTPEADKLRAAIAAAGFIEKGDELSNGGDITASASKLGVSLIDTVKKELPGITLRFTGGNDEYHQKLKGSKSRHKAGNALDFTIVPLNPDNKKAVLAVVQGYAAGMNGKVRYKDEYEKLTINASGAHMHISWGSGSEGNSELLAARTLARSNKIKTYTV
jgi:hypothetical protein